MLRRIISFSHQLELRLLRVTLDGVCFCYYLRSVPAPLRIALVAPLTLQVLLLLLLLLLNLLLYFLNLLNLLLLVILQFTFAPLRIFRLVPHLRVIRINIQFNRVLRRCGLVISTDGLHLFLWLVLLNFLYFIISSLVNFILWLWSFIYLIRKNNMRVLIRRLIIFGVVTLICWIIICRNHLGLGVLVLLTLETNPGGRLCRRVYLLPCWFLFTRYFLLS